MKRPASNKHMTTTEIYAVQVRLTALGYTPGVPDGVLGRATMGAIAAFQKAKHLDIKWPGTLGPKTLAALNLPEAEQLSLPWYDEVKRRMGLHELSDRRSLMSWLRSDGSTLGDPSKLPWCGDLVQTALALTLPEEVLPSNPYLARNWSRFGKEVPLQLGAVLVFWRGARSGFSGHVGFAAGQNGKRVYVLGGNQSNRISITPLDTERLLAVRWPLTYVERNIALPLRTGGATSTNEV